MKKTFFITFFACFFIFTSLCFPEALFSAGADGVSLWFDKVLPSLFPFMVTCGLLYKLGIAAHIGNVFAPLMRPLFRLPGIAAFPLVLGVLSGYPMGAKITAMLYEEKKISLSDAEHILSFCNNPGPLFLAGTVGTVFLGNPYWGYAFLLCAFLGSLLTGIIYRFFKPVPKKERRAAYLPSNADPTSLADALSYTIQSSMDTITQIGGYIILFNVIAQALTEVSFFTLINQIFFFIPVSNDFLQGFSGGILEMTTGCHLLSQAADCTVLRLSTICFLVSFGGLSILSQTFGVLRNVPVQKGRYVLCKICNAFFSTAFFCILYPYFAEYAQKAVSASSLSTETASSFSLLAYVLLAACIFTMLILKNKT